MQLYIEIDEKNREKRMDVCVCVGGGVNETDRYKVIGYFMSDFNNNYAFHPMHTR